LLGVIKEKDVEKYCAITEHLEALIFATWLTGQTSHVLHTSQVQSVGSCNKTQPFLSATQTYTLCKT
jgi:hypothetical protein